VRNEKQKQLHHNHHHHIHLPTEINLNFGRAKNSDGTDPDKLLPAKHLFESVQTHHNAFLPLQQPTKLTQINRFQILQQSQL